ncbi:electron transfer flavoprotein subunit beta/FixA family protein [Clostridium saccharobutylicum]|uniref:Electron transfer flavoprotein small subunit n=1 Tax=Clostridium saccharobutylicum DSM 13864 TaxID=1345695 RepID=U5MUU9_CLOSA|nr:electron transfer flavoprotein subunit beta/FixA family protein [Clostridium saccharobutylicum]AGX43232.1 electron transfer flavoprotein subunit beta [Clostridium saccharobutylicum DSM 13864]AQR90533.1 acryloyl-CoA reductase electron transfer subunit gamma [Clostridium saccharobutylicum]AQS00437.1 acryloyl-CoA reductase electron transfer subunit gamma [Clostridium saccharobutylicum]AQS14420.1 acryloyl-CoA reductase electron transfer subunit gamma [Clostridium saccharobutylicum]MBA2906899.1 
MNIVVCIKQVPDTTEIKIDPVKNTLIRNGVPSILNPFDKNALEQALRLKDQYGGTVTAISMGPNNAKAVLREALSLGADKAYLITDRAFGGSDTYATSYILSKAIQKIGTFDFILVGKQAIDGDTRQTGSSIAEHLNINRLSHVLDIKMEGDKCIVKRQIEEGIEVVEAKLPVLCTITKESNKPRYATIKRKIDSLKAEIKEINLSDMPDTDITKIGLKGSPTRVKATFTPKRQASGEIIEVKNPKETAKNLVCKLLEAKLL